MKMYNINWDRHWNCPQQMDCRSKIGSLCSNKFDPFPAVRVERKNSVCYLFIFYWNLMVKCAFGRVEGEGEKLRSNSYKLPSSSITSSMCRPLLFLWSTWSKLCPTEESATFTAQGVSCKLFLNRFVIKWIPWGLWNLEMPKLSILLTNRRQIRTR